MTLARALSVASIVALLALAACARQPPPATASPSPTPTQQRTVAAFTRIEVRGPVSVDVHEGHEAKVTATTAGPADALITRVEKDTLVIDLETEHCFGICIDARRRDEAHVVVDLPRLDGVSIDGSGDVVIDGAGEHTVVDLAIEGSGDLRWSGSADALRCSIEGSGDIVASGKGKRLEARVDGSGDVDARAFEAEGGLVVIDGSGDVLADLHGDVAVRIHGSGDLHYTGDARFTELDLSGSGEVHRR